MKTSFKVISNSFKNFTIGGFKCDSDEIFEFIETLERHIHQYTVEIVRRLFRDINTNLLRKFNKMFKKDENGKNRNWRDIEEN